MQDLIVIENINPNDIFSNGGIEPLLQKIAAEAKSQLIDISNEAGRKNVASLAYKIARSKTLLDDMGDKLVEDSRRKVTAVNAERKKVRDFLDALKDEVRKPLTDWEQADKDRIARHEANLAEIRNGGTTSLQSWQTLPVEAMQDRLAEIEAEAALDWQEFSALAAQAVETALLQINEAIGKRKKHDADQEELARLRKADDERRQRERDEQIAKDAADATRRQADQEIEAAGKREADAVAAAAKAEREQKEAAEKSERDRKEAAAKAERDQQAAVEAERKRVADAEKAEAAARQKREADLQHRGQINRTALSGFVSAGLSEGDAKAAVEAIAKGIIPNVSISY